MLFGRVRVSESPLGIDAEATTAETAIGCESSPADLVRSGESRVSGDLAVAEAVTLVLPPPACETEDHPVLAAIEVASADCVAEVARIESVSPRMLETGPTRPVRVAALSTSSVRMAAPRIERARTARLDCRTAPPERFRAALAPAAIASTRAPLPRSNARSARVDRIACGLPLTRSAVVGGVTPTLLTQAMRALVSRTGLPPRSLRLLGVFAPVPLAPISRLEVQSDGKQVRLWYPEGARAPAAARLAVARGLDDQRVYAAVLPPE